MSALTRSQQRLLDSIIYNFNHDQTLTIQDTATFPSFPNYEISGQFILNVVDNYKFYGLLAKYLDDDMQEFDPLFKQPEGPKAIIQELIQELGAAGKLTGQLKQYGLAIADFSINE